MNWEHIPDDNHSHESWILDDDHGNEWWVFRLLTGPWADSWQAMWLERNKKHSRMASLTTRVKGQQVGPLHYLPNTAEALKSAIDAMIAAGVVVPKDDFLETQIKDGMTIKQIIAELKKIAA